MITTVINSQRKIKIRPSYYRRVVPFLLESLQIDTAEVILHFVSEHYISELHKKYFNDPSPTDCISFPYDSPGEGNNILGEIFVCPIVAKTYVEAHQGNMERELILYVIHGLLHLLGYDDITPEQKKIMRRKEKYCLNLLKSFECESPPPRGVRQLG